MLNILFIGDITGKMGRKTVAKIVPRLKKEKGIDLVIANAENAAHGNGITKNTLKELEEAGVDYFTMGDHAFKVIKQLDEVYANKSPLIRPANYPEGVPGQGYKLINYKKYKILLINLIGRVYMKQNCECPFKKIKDILANFAKQNLSAIIVDIHAEATSEKVSIGHFVDGKVSAVLGTHTHIMTADHKITENGMAYITDVGMAGAEDESLGIEKEGVIKTFLTQINTPHILPEKGKAIFNSVLIKVNPKTAKAESIRPITKHIEIK